MNKFNQYMYVFQAFKKICSQGKQPCSFWAFCRHIGVDRAKMKDVIKKIYQSVTTSPGYKRMTASVTYISEHVRYMSISRIYVPREGRPPSFKLFSNLKSYKP